MDIPNFRRGLELNSTELNKLSNAIRSAAVTSVIGGTFSRTPGGTTIIVDAQVRGGSGGGVIPCPFKCTDASDAVSLKIEVTQGLISGRWPEDMGIDSPPFILEITGNSYIYAAIYWDIENLQIGPDPDAITIIQSGELLQNTDTMQYILLATIVTDGSPLAITEITNVCEQPVPNPCLLDWSA